MLIAQRGATERSPELAQAIAHIRISNELDLV